MGNDRRRHGNNQPPYQRTCNHEQPHRPGQAVQNHQTALWANGLAFFSEEAEPMDAEPDVLEYFIFSFMADFGEVMQELIAEEMK